MTGMLRSVKAAAAPIVKRGLSGAAAYTGLYRLAGNAYGGVGVILTLHRVVEPGRPVLWPGYMIHADVLDFILRTTRRLGWEIISIDEMSRRLAQNNIRQRFACFTCDDGYVDNLQVALPVFRKHHAPFSVNICTGLLDRSTFYWWGGLDELVVKHERIEFARPGKSGSQVLWARTWQEKRRAYDTLDAMCHASGPSIARDLFQRYGVDWQSVLDRDAMTVAQARQLAEDPLVTIGSHCMTHERLSSMNDIDSYREIHDGKRLLEAWLGTGIHHLSYPFGVAAACGPREFVAAKEAGFRTAVTTRRGNIFPEHRDFVECLPRRGVPLHLMGLRNALFGVESMLRRMPRFRTV